VTPSGPPRVRGLLGALLDVADGRLDPEDVPRGGRLVWMSAAQWTAFVDEVRAERGGV
jgi:hypothetical protein